MRDKFNEQLEQLNVELIRMGALCEEGISAATKALLDQDDDLRESAMAAEREIDQKERDIENLCMKLLLQQQPVASDLRAISAALKMISDMERIGDQAADIAEITRFIADSPLTSRVSIAEMARSVIGMVTDSIDSYVRKNLELAQSVVRKDDEIDELFLNVKNELIRLIGQGDDEERADPPHRPGGRRRGVHRPADDRQVPGAHRRPCGEHRPVGGVLPHRTAQRGLIKYILGADGRRPLLLNQIHVRG